jgi:hypothetical protein
VPAPFGLTTARPDSATGRRVRPQSAWQEDHGSAPQWWRRRPQSISRWRARAVRRLVRIDPMIALRQVSGACRCRGRHFNAKTAASVRGDFRHRAAALRQPRPTNPPAHAEFGRKTKMRYPLSLRSREFRSEPRQCYCPCKVRQAGAIPPLARCRVRSDPTIFRSRARVKRARPEAIRSHAPTGRYLVTVANGLAAAFQSQFRSLYSSAPLGCHSPPFPLFRFALYDGASKGNGTLLPGQAFVCAGANKASLPHNMRIGLPQSGRETPWSTP